MLTPPPVLPPLPPLRLGTDVDGRPVLLVASRGALLIAGSRRSGKRQAVSALLGWLAETDAISVAVIGSRDDLEIPADVRIWGDGNETPEAKLRAVLRSLATADRPSLILLVEPERLTEARPDLRIVVEHLVRRVSRSDSFLLVLTATAPRRLAGLARETLPARLVFRLPVREALALFPAYLAEQVAQLPDGVALLSLPGALRRVETTRD